MTPVETCPITKLTAVTTISMMFIGSRSWVSATTKIDGGFSALISLRPYRDKRDVASVRVKPLDRSDPRAAETSTASRTYGSGASRSALGPELSVALPLMTVISLSPIDRTSQRPLNRRLPR